MKLIINVEKFKDKLDDYIDPYEIPGALEALYDAVENDMGVYIKGMKMPESCNKCPFTCEALQFFNGKDRPQSCPLIEIVTCGECKYWRETVNGHINIGDHLCHRTMRWTLNTDYCSDGEKIAEEV